MSDTAAEPQVDRRLWAFIGFLGIALGGILAAALYALTVERPGGNPRKSAQRRPTARVARISTREAGRAFREGATPPDYEATEPFEDLFADIALAIGSQDTELFIGRVNLAALRQQIQEQAGETTITEEDSLRAARGIVTRFVMNAPDAGEADFQICRIRRSEVDGVSTAVVYTRRPAFNYQVVARQVWWLREQDGAWEVYDFGDVGACLRASTVAAECAQGNVDESTLATLMSYLPNIMADNYLAAMDVIQTLRGKRLPPSLEVYRAYIELDAAQRMPWQAEAEAEVLLERFEKLAPRMPALAARKANQALDDERHEATLTHVEQYTRTLGYDRGILLVKAMALAGLNRVDEAVAVHQRALADYPYATEHLTQLARLLPDERSGEVVEAFRRMSEPTEWYTTVAETLLAAEEFVDLEAMTEVMRELSPGAPAINYYHGAVLDSRGEYAEAAESYASAFGRVEEEEQLQYYVNGFVSAMMADLRVEDAYARAPLSKHAFRRVADQLLFPENYVDSYLPDCEFVKVAGDDPASKERRFELYRMVSNRHLPIEADDPWIAYYDGQLAVLEKRYDDAERIFATLEGQALPDDVAETVRYARLGSLYLAERDAYALEHVAPARETFRRLASHCESEKKWDRLIALVEHAKQAAPADPLLHYFSGVAAKGQARWSDAIRDLQAFVATEVATADGAPEPGAVDAHDIFVGRAALVRALVGAGRWDEALAQQSRLEYPGAAALDKVYIHAAQGDLAATEAALARYVEQDFELANLYADEDLGPLLRGEAFAALREKYPEPKPAPSARD